jgi:hypothetical protein
METEDTVIPLALPDSSQFRSPRLDISAQLHLLLQAILLTR